MQRRALDVLGQRVVLGEDVGRGIADHAGNRRGLRQALLLHQQFERPVAAAAGRDLEHAGLGALGVEHRPDVEALKQRAPGDVLGQLLDRDAGLHAPDVRLAEHQLVEGNVARGRQGDLLNGSSHGDSLRDGRPRDSLSTSNPSRRPAQPSSSRDRPQSRRAGDAHPHSIRLCVTAGSAKDVRRVQRRKNHAASCSAIRWRGWSVVARREESRG